MAGEDRRQVFSLTLVDRERTVDRAFEADTAQPAEEFLAEATLSVGGLNVASPMLRRTGAGLPTGPLRTSGLRAGDIVVLEPTIAAGPRVWLEVVTGPAAGHRIDLDGLEVEIRRGMRIGPVTLDDPFTSAVHATIGTRPSLRIVDHESRNGTFVNGRGTTESTLTVGDVVEVGASTFVVCAQDPPLGEGVVVDGTSLSVRRSRRFVAPAPSRSLDLGPPPGPPRARRLKPFMLLLPLLPAIGVFAATRDPRSVLFLLLMPAMRFGQYWDDRQTGRADHAADTAKFDERLARVEEEAEGAAAQASAWRRERWPSAADALAAATAYTPDLWSRTPADDTFLHVRLGLTALPSLSPITLGTGSGEPQRAAAEELIARFAVDPDQPLTLSLAEVPVLGVAGEEPALALVRSLVVQLAALHSPAELVVGVISSSVDEQWAWVRWLPHAGAGAPATALQHLCREDPAATLAAVADIVAARQESGSLGLDAHIVLVVDVLDTDQAALRRLVGDAIAVNVSLVLVAPSRRLLGPLPMAVVDVDPQGEAVLTRSAEAATSFTVEGLARSAAGLAARRMAPLRDPSGAAAGGELPDRIDLRAAVAGIDHPESIMRSWEQRRGGLGAPIGVRSGKELQIDPVTDGPHGLVVGTTQAGKSELLQTLILSMAARHSPDDLQIYLIDYKGGATIEGLRKLPHLVDALTNRADTTLTARAVTSLRAELDRRGDHIVQAHGFANIRELNRNRPEAALPRLLVIVDELAHVKTTYPAFTEAFLDITARGAAFGMHLIVATQLPDTIDDAIKGNTDLKLVLRLQNANDSVKILDRRGADQIPRTARGRGFSVTGGSGSAVPFQTYFAGGTAEGKPDVAPSEQWAFGQPQPQPDTDVLGDLSAADEETVKDLHVIAAAISSAWELRHRGEGPAPRPPSPTTPPLPERLSLADVRSGNPEPAGHLRLPIGHIDDLARARRSVLELDFESASGYMVFGAPGSGRTTLLRTAAASAALAHRPEELVIYGFDLGRGELFALRSLDHCGGVVDGRDDGALRAMIRFLVAEADERRSRFGPAAELTVDDRPAEPTPPRILVLVDSCTAVAKRLEHVDLRSLLDQWIALVADGPGLGMHFVMTAERPVGHAATMMQSLTGRLALHLSRDLDYQELGIRPADVHRLDVKGRGLTTDDQLFQVATLARHNEDEGAAFRRLDAHRGRIPDAARFVPLTPTSAAEAMTPAQPGDAELPVAVDERRRGVAVDLSWRLFYVAGPSESGRSTLLATLAAQHARARPAAPRYLLAPGGRSPSLMDLAWTEAAHDRAGCASLASRLVEVLGSGPAGGLVVIDDADELRATMASTEERAFNSLLAAAEASGALVAAATTPRPFLAAGSTHLLTPFRDAKRGVLLHPDGEMLVQFKQPRVLECGPQPPPGRGVATWLTRPSLIQTAAAEGPHPSPR